MGRRAGPRDVHMNQIDFSGCRIARLLQAVSDVGVSVEEFGEATFIILVVELEDGRRMQLGETDWSYFQDDQKALNSAELVQDQYSLSDIEGQSIETIEENDEGIVLILGNGLRLSCPSAPGGNYPWISRAEQTANPTRDRTR